MEDHVSQVEKEQAIAAFASKQERMFWTGRIIIWIVAILDIVKAIVSLIVDEAPGNFLHLIGVIALSITLIRGFTWVRVLRGTLAFFYAIGLFGIILIVLVPGMIEAKKAGMYIGDDIALLVFYSIWLLHEVASFLFMFFGKSVQEYTYGVNEQF